MRRRSLTAAALAAGVLAGCGGTDGDAARVGLVLKQEENPYWLTMLDVAEQTASQEGATLVTAAGTSDVDVDGQVAAIERMVDDGVDGILLTANDSEALAPAIAAAREEGVVVIALDTPVEPADSVDALFATDNREAGALIGRYASARAAQLGLDPVVVTLDLAPGITSGEERRAGFLEGMGLGPDDPAIVAAADTEGDFELARDAMAQALRENPEVNVVYSVNERAALGALEALEESDVDPDGLIMVSVDGGCQVMKEAVRPGLIDATAQQYPENMAREGVRAVVDVAAGEPAPTGWLDTGVQLVTGTPVDGVPSRDVEFGVRNCWGG